MNNDYYIVSLRRSDGKNVWRVKKRATYWEDSTKSWETYFYYLKCVFASREEAHAELSRISAENNVVKDSTKGIIKEEVFQP